MVLKNGTIKKRSLVGMFFLCIFTCGLYTLYWWYKTKNEINSIGGTIPPYWFSFLPILRLYFDFRYAQDFVRFVRQDNDAVIEWGYFFLILFMPFLRIFIIQYDLNKYAKMQ